MASASREQELELARKWHQRGLLAPGALATLEGEATDWQGAAGPSAGGPAPGRTDDGSVGSQVLHGLGGALLGAAGIALVMLMDIPGPNGNTSSAWILGALGGCGIAVGMALLFGLKQRNLADAFLIGGLLCLTVSPLPDRDVGRILAPACLVASLAVPVLRRGEMLAAFCSVTFAASLFLFIERTFGEPSWFFSNIPDNAITLWFILALAHLAAVVAGSLLLRAGWLRSSLGLEPVAVVAPAVAFIFAVVAPDQDSMFFARYGGAEILLALLEGALVAFALWRRESPLLIGAAAVICVDAIIFAFDVGGIQFGVVSLLLVAVAVLGLATYMRRRWNRPANPVRPAV